MSLVQAGFSYDSAVHLSPRDTDKFLAIASATSIAPDDRVGGVLMATGADLDRMFGD